MSLDKLMEIYKLLYDRYGPQHWWPGQSRFEIIVGAILTQNTNWANVEKAIANLKRCDCLSQEKLYKMDTAVLAELIRPAGYYNIKTGRLKNFLNRLFDNYNGSLKTLENLSTDTLRYELLMIKGIGPETADSIVLYAFDKPVFVVDTYTCRIMTRHGFLAPGADYEEVQQLFESCLPTDTGLFNEYHALLVQAGKQYCRPKPKCANCPLKSLPYEIDEWY